MTGNPDAPVGSTVILQPGDALIITFSDAEDLGEKKVRIHEDGTIGLPMNVSVQAAGKTPAQLRADIRTNYVPRYFKFLSVEVRPEERLFYVSGEVRKPDRYPFVTPITVTKVIDTAGGFTEFAKRGELELTRANGRKFRINWRKAIKDAKFDPPVFPNDQVFVPKRYL